MGAPMTFGVQFLRLYPDVTRLALWGVLCLIVSAYAAWADRRRFKRKKLDAVSLMPWPTISILALFTGLLLFAFAAHEWKTS